MRSCFGCSAGGLISKEDAGDICGAVSFFRIGVSAIEKIQCTHSIAQLAWIMKQWWTIYKQKQRRISMLFLFMLTYHDVGGRIGNPVCCRTSPFFHSEVFHVGQL